MLLDAAIALRPHDAQSIAALRRWYEDPEITRLSRHRQRGISDEEFSEVIVARIARAETLSFAIYERTSALDAANEGEERLVGSCTLSSLDLENGSATYHIVIGEPSARGRGIGRAATRLVADFAFDGLGLARLSLSVFAFNVAAMRCYAAAGFREEGRSRDAIVRDGRRWDEVKMGLLATEHPAASK